MSEQLLPCPFCGGEASGNGYWRTSRPLEDTAWADGSPVTEGFYAHCIRCGATPRGVGFVTGYQTKAEAIAAWNTRSPSPVKEPVS